MRNKLPKRQRIARNPHPWHLSGLPVTYL